MKNFAGINFRDEPLEKDFTGIKIFSLTPQKDKLPKLQKKNLIKTNNKEN